MSLAETTAVPTHRRWNRATDDVRPENSMSLAETTAVPTHGRWNRGDSAVGPRHQNCSRKRMSLLNSSRKSSAPWRLMAMRSIPKPNANPE